jgi:pimeloyl-ACP methyl ester carboxylesterase
MTGRAPAPSLTWKCRRRVPEPNVVHEKVRANGIELHVASAGPADGPPVVLCHGFPELWYSWRHQLGALADAGYRALAPDLRGYGGSSHPDEVSAYGSDQLTGDLCGLLDHYGYEQAAFSGHDWGAMVVWEMGRLHPERVASICNMSVPYSNWPGKPTELFEAIFAGKFFYMLYFQEVGPAEAEFDSDPRRFVRSILYSASAEGMSDGSPSMPDAPREGTRFTDVLTPAPEVLPPWLHEHDVDTYVEGLTRGGLFGPVSFYRNMDANWERSKDLPSTLYTMPTAFVTGALDPVLQMMPGATEVMTEALPDFRGTTVVEGAGHWVQQERPKETNEALLAFLADAG